MKRKLLSPDVLQTGEPANCAPETESEAAADEEISADAPALPAALPGSASEKSDVPDKHGFVRRYIYLPL